MTDVMNATGFEQPLADSDAVIAWLADGLVPAAEAALDRLDEWMAYDMDNEAAVAYGYVVDRDRAYMALADLIKSVAFERATASLNRFKADRAAQATVSKLDEQARRLARAHLSE